jgi:hypothetical protein
MAADIPGATAMLAMLAVAAPDIVSVAVGGVFREAEERGETLGRLTPMSDSPTRAPDASRRPSGWERAGPRFRSSVGARH